MADNNKREVIHGFKISNESNKSFYADPGNWKYSFLFQF